LRPLRVFFCALITVLALTSLGSRAYAQPASPAATSISGTATDASGNPLPGVTITLTGPASATTTSGPDGRYTFAAVVPGLYTVTALKAGYSGTSQTDYAVAGGTSSTLNVTLTAATFSSLQEIGRVTVNAGRSSFNTSPASVSVVTAQTFGDQGQPQVARILNQTPGIVDSLPGGVNGASPGAISFPNIRGALSFETAALVDGHPLSVGQYGDYVTTFLNSFILQSVEVIKGPGASSPTISRAIGGTVNFRTLDPTPHQTGTFTIGEDSYGGLFSNVGYSNTFGRVGVLIDYAVDGTPGPLQDTPSLMALNSSTYLVFDSRGNPVTLPAPTVTNTNPPGQYNTRNEAATELVFCCQRGYTTYTNKNELVKLRYAFSGNTSFTAAFLGSQTYADQNGNNGNRNSTLFTPGAGYAGSVGAGVQPIIDPDNFGVPAWEVNNEPMFSGEFRTSIGNDSLLARYYSASISRLQYGSNHDPNGAASFSALVYGGGTADGTPVFNGLDQYGKPYTIQLPSRNDPSGIGGNAYYDSAEEDKLAGYSGEYDHPFGGASGDVLTLSYDANHSRTHSYSYGSSTDAVPAGSTQDTNTLLLRGIFNFGKLNVTASNYLTDFRSHFGVYQNAFSAQQYLSFQDQDLWHYDARLGLEYRPDRNLSLRASAGSAVAPPYLGALVADAFPPQLCGGSFTPCPPGGGQVAVSQQSNPNLKAETSFGYDIGGDLRLGDGVTVLTTDLYLTNLHNQLIQSTFLNGTATIAGSGVLPLYTTAYSNVSQARYEGVEFGIRRDPRVGLGYAVQGALLRAYPYNISPSFYAGSGGSFTTNLGVVPNINFGSHLTVDNQAIPYSQGYAEIRARTRHGELFLLGETYYGTNNSLNVPAFFVANATARTPVNKNAYVQLSVDNLFNALGGSLPVEYAGNNQPLVGGQFYASNANVIGPRVVRLSFTINLGSR
jgi:outer membrane receptor protein involved in Fe transport